MATLGSESEDMKPEVSCHFNAGQPVVLVTPDGYMFPKEAIEHGVEVITQAVGLLQDQGSEVDPTAAVIARQAAEIERYRKLYANCRNRESELAMAIGLDGFEFGAKDVSDRFTLLRKKLEKSEGALASLMTAVIDWIDSTLAEDQDTLVITVSPCDGGDDVAGR